MAKIENAIKQKSFKSEYHKLTINLLFTHGWLMECHKKILGKHNLTLAQYNVLRILRGQHPTPVSVSLIKDRMIDKMSDTSRLVERLRIKRLIERKECPDDRRKSDVIISNAGIKLLKKLDYIDNKFDEILSSISKNEAKILNGLLDKLRG